MKIIIIIMMLSLSLQKDVDMNNVLYRDDLKFEVRKYHNTPTNKNTITSEYLIKVELNEIDSVCVSQIENEDWLVFLRNESSSWNANLILYSIYERDAMWYFYTPKTVNLKDIWFENKRSSDIDDWESFLKIKK